MGIACRSAMIAAGLTLAAGIVPLAIANPITVTTPFLQLYNVNVNSLGFTTGESLRIGADSVVPNGRGGTTGVATTTNTVTGAAVSRNLTFITSPLVPNLVQGTIPYEAGLHGPWTMTFTNGADTWQRQMSLPSGAPQAPFVNSITLSGTSSRPTFSWTPPAGATVNGYRVNIYDKSLVNLNPAAGPINSGQVVSVNLSPASTSYTVNPIDFLVPGNAFQLGRNYSIEISLLQTRDGSTSNLSNTNVYAISRVYADFTPVTGGGPAVNLPVVLANGSFKFDIAVQAGQTYYIDPEIAIGYDYAIGAADDLYFQSVVLPFGIGDNRYDIYRFDALDNLVLLANDWLGGEVFDFGPDGIDRFRVLGIETFAGLDPANTTAFVTGLTFTNDGQFTGTQTPITVNVTTPVPSPGTLLLLGLGFAGLATTRRQS